MVSGWFCLRVVASNKDIEEKTYRHFIHRLLSRVGIEEGVVLCSNTVDAESRKGGLVGWTLHRYILDYKIGLARHDIELPDASQ